MRGIFGGPLISAARLQPPEEEKGEAPAAAELGATGRSLGSWRSRSGIGVWGKRWQEKQKPQTGVPSKAGGSLRPPGQGQTPSGGQDRALFTPVAAADYVKAKRGVTCGDGKVLPEQTSP